MWVEDSIFDIFYVVSYVFYFFFLPQHSHHEHAIIHECVTPIILTFDFLGKIIFQFQNNFLEFFGPLPILLKFFLFLVFFPSIRDE